MSKFFNAKENTVRNLMADAGFHAAAEGLNFRDVAIKPQYLEVMWVDYLAAKTEGRKIRYFDPVI